MDINHVRNALDSWRVDLMRVNQRQITEIVELIHDCSDFDIDVNGYHDFDIMPYIPDCNKEEINRVIREILEGSLTKCLRKLKRSIFPTK